MGRSAQDPVPQESGRSLRSEARVSPKLGLSRSWSDAEWSSAFEEHSHRNLQPKNESRSSDLTFFREPSFSQTFGISTKKKIEFGGEMQASAQLGLQCNIARPTNRPANHAPGNLCAKVGAAAAQSLLHNNISCAWGAMHSTMMARPFFPNPSEPSIL